MLTSSSAAQALFDNQENLVRSGRGVVLSQQAIANATQNMTIKAKLATVGLKALSIAGNMLLFAGISMGISALFKGIDYLIHRNEKLQEALEESASEFNEATDEVKELETRIAELSEKIADLQRLADNGTISVADEKQLELLKDENEELERQLALKQAQQAADARDVLKDAKKTSKSTVTSKYSYTTRPDNSKQYRQVTAGEELTLAIAAFNNGDKDASSRIEDMYEKIAPTIEAYEDLIAAGIKLEGEDKVLYEQLKKNQDAYLMYAYNINGTKEAFAGLNEEQQKTVLLNRLIKQGLSEDYAKAIINSINPEDLDKYWDANFKFTPPDPNDYDSAEEYGKAYAEAWAKSVEDNVQGSTFDNKMTDSLENLSKRLDNIQSAYKTVQSAIEEYNQTGALSVDTFQELMTLEPQYLNMLLDENGNLNLNTDAVNANTAAYIENMGIKAAQNLIDSMSNYKGTAEQLKYLTGVQKDATATGWDFINEQLAEMALVSDPTVMNALYIRIDAIKAMTNAAKAGIGKGGIGGFDKATDKSKKSAEKLKKQFELVNHELEKFESNLELLSDKLDMTFDKDYSVKIKSLGEQFLQAGKYSNSLRGELNNLLQTIPKNAEEAEVLASQLESLGDKFYDNQRKIIEYRKEASQARADLIGELAELASDASSQMSDIVNENFDIMERGSITGGLFSKEIIAPYTMDAVERQREENEELIDEEKYYREAIAEIRKKAIEMAQKETEEASKAILSTVQSTVDKVEDIVIKPPKIDENLWNKLEKDVKERIARMYDVNPNLSSDNYLGRAGILPSGTTSSNGAVYYNQGDYGMYKYGGGTIQSSGCGPTAMAMVASTITGKKIDPVAVAKYSMDNGHYVSGVGTGWGLFSSAAKEYGLNYSNIPATASSLIEALKLGKLVIVSEGKGLWSSSTGHFIVLTGLTEDGKILVNDPGSRQRTQQTWDISDITKTAKNAWTFHATGTQDYGIAGENYKKEWAISKKTGKWHAITSPTLFNKKEYDIVGEKVSEKIDEPIETFSKGTIKVPSGLGKYYTYMNWDMITNMDTNQGKLINTVGKKYDSEGYGRIGDRYALAMTSTYGNVGDMVDVYMVDGSVLRGVLADVKSQTVEYWDTNPANKWGHNNGQNVVEFITNWGEHENPEGNGGVVKVENLGSIYEGDTLNKLSQGIYTISENTKSVKDILDDEFKKILLDEYALLNETNNKIEETYNLWKNDFTDRFEKFLFSENRSKNTPFAKYDGYAEEAYTKILDVTIEQAKAAIIATEKSVEVLQAMYDEAKEGYESAKTADEQASFYEQMQYIQDELTSKNEEYNNNWDIIQKALVSKVNALDGDYVNSMSYLSKNNEKLMRTLEDADITERGSIREQILANFQRQLDTATERQNKNLQAIEDMYTNATETQKYMLENYKVQEVFDADGELNSNFEEIKSLMIANGDEELVNEFVNFVTLYQEYLKNSKEASNDINNIKDDIKSFKNDYNSKVETYLDIQEALVDVLDSKLAKQEAKYNATSNLFDFQQTLRQEKLDAEAQLNANKHLQEWLDPETIALLYNDEDHSAYTAEIDRINGKIESKYNEYLSEISSLKPEEMYKEAEITAKWEQQLAILKEELDVAKGSYEVQKKTLELANSAKERDTQIIMGNRIVNVADPERMYNLTNEKVQLENEAALTQQKITDNDVLRGMERENLSLQTDINAINQFIDEIGNMPEEMLEKWSESLPSEDTLLAYYGSVVGSPTKWMNEHVDDFMGIIAGLTITDIGDISNTLVDYQAIRNNLVDTFGEGNPIIEAIDNLLFAHKYTKSGSLVDFEQYHNNAYYSNYGSEYRDTKEELPSLSERNIQAEMDAIIANANKNGGQLLESDYAELAKLETLRNKKIYENDLDYEQTSKYGGQIFGLEKSSPNIELVDGSGILIDGTLYVAQGDVEIIHKKNNRDAISDMIENGTLASSMQSVSYDLMNNLATNTSIVNSLLNSLNKQIPNKSYTFGDIIIENTADVNGIINEFSTKFINIVETTDNMSD